MGYFWSDVYKLEKGHLIEIGGWSGHLSDIDPETGEWIDLAPGDIVEVIDWYRLNGTEVTKERYEEAINSYTGGDEFQRCSKEEQMFSLLDFLHWWSIED